MARSNKKQNPLKRLRLWLLLFALMLIAAFIVFAIWSDQHRAATLAAIQPSPESQFHDRLAQAQQAKDNQLPALELQPTLDTIASWTKLLQRKKDEVDGEEWDAVLDLWQAADTWDALTPEDAARIITFLDQHRGFMKALRAMAALGGPVQAVALNPPDNGASEHLAEMRDCARLIALDAVARAQTGESELALADCIAGMQLFDALATEPALFNQLVRFAMAAIVHQALQEAFSPGVLSKDAVGALIAQAQAAAGREVLVPAFREYHLGMKRELGDMLEKDWFDRYGELEELFLAGNPRLSSRALFFAYSSPIAQPWANTDVSRGSELMDVSERCLEYPYYRAIEILTDSEREILRGVVPLAHTMAQGAFEIHRAQANHEVRLQLLQIGLSLELHQTEHGAAPDNLNMLSPALPDSTFIDPYTGNPFLYKPDGDTFLLYSVGRNLADDGGRHDLNTGDFVWRGKMGPSRVDVGTASDWHTSSD